MLHSINPATNQLLRSFAPLTPELLEARLALAAEAARTYPLLPLHQRIFWMRRLAALLEADTEELAGLITAEMGKTLASARAEVAKCALCCRYYAEHAASMLAPDDIPAHYESSLVRYEPLGVIFAIMPWNFPFWQVFRFLAPALMGGNVGLLKHAPSVPQCALALEALVRRAGFPRGAFQALLLEDAQAEIVIADARVAAVTLTGSEAAGKAVAAQAGWFLKKTVLELGGCDAFLVLPGCDLSSAVTAAVASRTLNNGQSCIAAKRFLIHDALYDEFEARFTAAMAALRVGDPTDPATDLGPLAMPRTLHKLLAQVDAAVAAGGRVLTGGRILPSDGNYIRPTVIVDVPRDAPVAHEETFGPLALLFRVSSLDDAITLANDTPFGLAATAFTNESAAQRRLSEQLHCGAVFFNTIVASDPRLPFGGTKHSGYGRELATAGMREFLNAKTVVIAANTAAVPLQSSLFDETPLPLAIPEPPKQAQPLSLEDQLLGDWQPPAHPRTTRPNTESTAPTFTPQRPADPATQPAKPESTRKRLSILGLD